MTALFKIRIFSMLLCLLFMMPSCWLVPRVIGTAFFVKAINIIGQGAKDWIVFETISYAIDAAYSSIFKETVERTEDSLQSNIRPISSKQPLLGRKVGDHQYLVEAAENGNNTITVSTYKVLFKRDDPYSKWYLTAESSALIRERLENATAQHSLIQKSYPTGSMDGIMGPKTITALKLFQRDKGLSQTGRLDDETKELLFTIKN